MGLFIPLFGSESCVSCFAQTFSLFSPSIEMMNDFIPQFLVLLSFDSPGLYPVNVIFYHIYNQSY